MKKAEANMYYDPLDPASLDFNALYKFMTAAVGRLPIALKKSVGVTGVVHAAPFSPPPRSFAPHF